MQLYVGDYLADTLDLTTEQHGAYLLLLITMWRHGAQLPDDPSKLCRIARVSPKRWPGIWSEISRFFIADGGYITNKRLTKEHQKAVSISQERKTAGSRGGSVSALKRQKATQASADDLLKHSQISDIRKEKEEPKGSSKKPAARSRQVPDDFEPTAAGMDYAVSKGMAAAEIPAQVAKFIAHHQSKGSTFRNVDRAWQTWCMNFAEFRRSRGPNVIPMTKPSAVDVRQYHPHAIDMGGGWWTTPGDEVEWYRDTADCRPDKRTRDRMAAEEAEALRGAI